MASGVGNLDIADGTRDYIVQKLNPLLVELVQARRRKGAWGFVNSGFVLGSSETAIAGTPRCWCARRRRTRTSSS